MPLTAADLVLINLEDLDSGTDGAGSGTDETAGAGRIIDLVEGIDLALMVVLRASDTGGEPGDADTLGITLELSGDGGSTYPDVTTSRNVLGSELPDDEAAGDDGVVMAVKFRTPIADAAQEGVVKCRLTTVASDTSNWGIYAAVVPVQSCRQEWFDKWLDVPA